MKSFKEFLADDRAVFLNPNEFGDLFRINGREMVAVLDQSADTEHPWAGDDGISVITHTLYVSLTDFGGEPRQDELININGDEYTIQRVDANLGMLQLGLEANVT